MTLVNKKTVQDIMTREVISLSPDTSLFEAAKILYKNRLNGLPVIDKNNTLLGILTEYDFINIDSAIHIPTLQKILQKFTQENFGTKKEFDAFISIKVGGIMNGDPLTLAENATLEETVAAFVLHHRVNPIPVIDSQRKVMGIVSRTDLVKFFMDFPSRPIDQTSAEPRLVDVAVNAFVEKSMNWLEEKTDILQSMFASANQAILITDPDAKILFANKAWEKLSGYSAQETIGRHPNELWGGHMPKEYYEKLWNTIKTDKKPFVGEVKNIRKDGTEYWQDDYITPILDEKGDIKFFMSIEPEITDKKQKEQFREEFISIIGHQLRNPLVSIRWLIESLTQSAAITSEDKNKIEEIYKQNKSLSSFVDDLLILSRVGKKDLKREIIDLNLEVEAIIKTVKGANPRVEFSFDVKGESFPLTTNKSMALQVFANLIYNAAEYSDRTAGRVVITLEKQDIHYLFSSQNNGPEIAEADKPKIFSKFFRSNMAQEIKKTGTGLGLFIIKTICDNFGWKIWFESQSGRGTTFYVKIPIQQ
ncbi:MAG: CBS domain-containing protein [Candidatus Sungbacteria bacterium]|nr:CBS domain-containing protein [Candidatus Sungbacteria bacterium]